MREFTVGKWLVKPDRNTVVRGSVERRLEPRVMDLLVYFAANPGRVLGRDQIISNVWPHSYVTDSALQTAVSALRKALDDDPRHPHILETIPKRGYRLVAASSAATPVVAVLPLSNLTGDDDNNYVADGMTDSLIASLSTCAGLRVISRQSVMVFRGSTLSLPDIATRLGADTIVEGSVVDAADPIAVTVQLIDATTDTHVWADSRRFAQARLFREAESVAGEIARRVSDGGRIAAPGAAAVDIDAEAVRRYLMGRFHWYKLSPEHFQQALEHFQTAIDIAPRFCAAHAGVADVWGALGYWGVMSATEVRSRVSEAVTAALEIDPDDADANMLAGAYQFYIERDWREARDRFEAAIDANPNLAHARLLTALFLAAMHDDGARGQVDEACRLDPLNPAVRYGSALCHCGTGRWERAESDLAQVLELDPSFPPALELSADLAWVCGRPDALELERTVWQHDAPVSEALAGTDGGDVASRLGEASRLLEKRALEQYVSPRLIARLYSLAGNTGAAIRILDAAVDRDDFMQVDLLCLLPCFAELRDNKDFEALRARIGLPAA